MLPSNPHPVEIESFDILGGASSGNITALRPVSGQGFASGLLVEGNKSLVKDYPAGTRFMVQAALLTRADGSQYLFSSWQWDVKVVAKPSAPSDTAAST